MTVDMLHVTNKGKHVETRKIPHLLPHWKRWTTERQPHNYAVVDSLIQRTREITSQNRPAPRQPLNGHHSNSSMTERRM